MDRPEIAGKDMCEEIQVETMRVGDDFTDSLVQKSLRSTPSCRIEISIHPNEKFTRLHEVPFFIFTFETDGRCVTKKITYANQRLSPSRRKLG